MLDIWEDATVIKSPEKKKRTGKLLQERHAALMFLQY